MIRKLIAVIAGYLIFAISSVMLFNLTGHKPHADAALSFKLITAAYGLIFSMLAGFVTQWVARGGSLKVNYILALIIFVFAAASMVLASGSHWTQLLAMFLFAPASILGGHLKVSRVYDR